MNLQDCGAATPDRSEMASRARAACVCTPFFSIRSIPERISICNLGCPAPFATDDGGQTWKPINRGLAPRSTFRTPTAEVRSLASIGSRCIHRAPNTPYSCKSTGDVMRSDERGGAVRGHEVSGNFAKRFRIFPIDVHAHESETIYVGNQSKKAIRSITRPAADCELYRQPDQGGQRNGKALTKGSAATQLLRKRIAADRDVG